MKTIRNVFLYIAQWLHLRMGGSIEVTRKRIILIAPEGQQWHSCEEQIEKALKEQDPAREKGENMKIDICNLRAPAKCSRCQNLHEVPFATSQACKECEHKRTANVEALQTAAEIIQTADMEKKKTELVKNE